MIVMVSKTPEDFRVEKNAQKVISIQNELAVKLAAILKLNDKINIASVTAKRDDKWAISMSTMAVNILTEIVKQSSKLRRIAAAQSDDVDRCRILGIVDRIDNFAFESCKVLSSRGLLHESIMLDAVQSILAERRPLHKV